MLNRTLTHVHYGLPNSTGILYHNELDIRTEVTYLTRNVKIQGDMEEDESDWGGQFVTGDNLEFDGS